MDKFDGIAPQDGMKKLRNQCLGRLRLLAFIILSLTPPSVIVGILAIIYSAPHPAFPYIAAAPIYASLIPAIGAIFCLLGVKSGMDKDEVPAETIRYIGIFGGLCNSGNTLNIMSSVWSIAGIVLCATHNTQCMPNSTQLLYTSIVSMIIGLALAITCMLSMCIHYRDCKKLGLRHEQKSCCCGC